MIMFGIKSKILDNLYGRLLMEVVSVEFVPSSWWQEARSRRDGLHRGNTSTEPPSWWELAICSQGGVASKAEPSEGIQGYCEGNLLPWRPLAPFQGPAEIKKASPRPPSSFSHSWMGKGIQSLQVQRWSHCWTYHCQPLHSPGRELT